MATTESCYNCVYSHWDRTQAMWSLSIGVPVRPTCGNQPDFPGRMRACLLGQICVNFRARPPTPEGETVKTIPLGNGFYAYVDAADYEWLSQWTWHLKDGYAIRLEKRKHVYMHRQIMQPPDGMMVDHKNLNKVDNTRVNLHVCTAQENACNRNKKRGTFSRFRGVSYIKRARKYLAQVYYKGETSFCGYHTDEVEAARAHDYKAVALKGEAARLNFPEDWPPQRRVEVYTQGEAIRRELVRKAGKKARRTEGKKGGGARSRSAGRKRRATSATPRASSREGRDRISGRKRKGKGKK